MLPIHLCLLIPLQQIINISWEQNHSGTEKLSRWIRCLFSLACSELNIAKQLLDQAVIIAEVAQKVCDSFCSR